MKIRGVIRKFTPAIRSDKRWVIAKGGRGSGKSWSMSDLMVAKMITNQKPILCTRPVQKSIRDSSHKLIAGSIKRMNASHLFDVQRNYIVHNDSGSEFIFTGMSDVKSMEGVQDVWIEEAEESSEEALQDLSPTLRSDGSQIYVTYNPKDPDSPVHVRATGEEYADIREVVTMNWYDNPHFPEVLNQERLIMKRFNTDLYNHVWGGQVLRTVEGALIKAKYFNRFDVIPNLLRSIIISDTASKAKEQHDYTVFLFVGLGIDGNIYLLDMLRGKWESVEREQQAIAFWNKHKQRNLYGIGATTMKIEDASSGTDLIQRLRRRRPLPIPVAEITRKKAKSGFEGKFGRLMDVFPTITGSDSQPGKVFLPTGDITYSGNRVTGSAWVSDFISECEQFTSDDSHDHDDQVDVLIDAVAEFAGNVSSAASALVS